MRSDAANWSDFVYYDETSPSCLRWKIDRGNQVQKDDVVGCVGIRGYWSFQTTVFGDNRRVYCHTVIWELLKGPVEDGFTIDHVDGISTRNVINNLRKITKTVNNRNVAMHRRNTSGICGVSRQTVDSRGKLYDYWVAQWRTLSGDKASAQFSIAKLGEESAKEAAIYRRNLEILALNKAGAEYTERHGKSVIKEKEQV